MTKCLEGDIFLEEMLAEIFVEELDKYNDELDEMKKSINRLANQENI